MTQQNDKMQRLAAASTKAWAKWWATTLLLPTVEEQTVAIKTALKAQLPTDQARLEYSDIFIKWAADHVEWLMSTAYTELSQRSSLHE